MMEPRDALREALAAHRSGHLVEAEALYVRALGDGEWLEALFNLAVLHAARDDLASAEQFYLRALDVAPDDAQIHANMANILQRQGRDEEAERTYRRALELDADLATAWANLAILMVRRQHLDEALAQYRQALDIDPLFAQAHANLAALLHDLGQSSEAMFHAETAVELLPEDPGVHLNLVILHRLTGELDQAEATLARLEEMHPGLIEATVERARLARLRGAREVEEELLLEAVAREPGCLPARRELTQLHLDLGRPGDALEIARETVARGGGEAADAYLLAQASQRSGEGRAALAHYETALGRAPASPEIRQGLASALQELGRNAEALTLVEELLAVAPDFAEALVTRGNCLCGLGRHDEAIEVYRRVLACRPELLVARYNLAHGLRVLGRLEEARAEFQAVLAATPECLEAFNGLGVVAQSRNDHEAALVHFEAALAIDANFGDAINNKAISLQRLGRYGEAVAAYGNFLELQPERAEVYFNLGGLLQSLERWDESIVVLRQGLTQDEGCPDIYPYLLHAQMQQCDWENLDAILAKVRTITENQLEAGGKVSFTPFALQSLPVEIPMALRRRVAERISENVALAVGAAMPGRRARGTRGEKLRIGYVSPDFRAHSVAVAFQGIVEHHDRDRFALHAFALNGGRPDTMTEYFRRGFDTFDDIAALTHQGAAERVAAREVDILIDLAGHTRGTRLELFALRPAPLAAHYLGYSATIGARYIDYLITDARQLSPGAEAHFTEALIRLPDAFMAARPAEISERPLSRADLGLPEDGFVFANFNKHYKHEPRMFGLVMRLLKRIPGSVYWLKQGTARSTENLLREATARGIAPSRIVIAPNWPHDEHLARLRLADLALDNLYHGGGVTTVDALWVGLPVLTIAGATPQSRNGASLLHAIDMAELVCEDLATFEAAALALATDPARLADVRRRLLANRATRPLFDIARLTRHLERAYETMWERHAAGRPPRGFEVPAED